MCASLPRTCPEISFLPTLPRGADLLLKGSLLLPAVVVGIVERIEPMRTTIRTDSGIPVTIPNKNIGESSQHSCMYR